MCSFYGKANNVVDSLESVWKDQSINDSSRMKALDRFTWKGYLFSQPDSAFYYANVLYNLAVKNNSYQYKTAANNMKGISWAVRNKPDSAIFYFKLNIKNGLQENKMKDVAAANMNIGNIYRQQGSFDQAITYYTKSSDFAKRAKDDEMQSKLYINLGLIYEKRGNVSQAVKSYTKALKAFERAENYEGINSSLINIGNIYFNQDEYDKALKYYKESIEYSRKTNNKFLEANSVINVGMVYRNKNALDSALVFYDRALNLFDGSAVQSKCYSSIGKIMLDKGNLDSAKVLFETCIELYEIDKDERGIASNQINLAETYFEKNDLANANAIANKALAFAKSKNDLSLLKSAYKILWKTNKKTGNYQTSLSYHENYLAVIDSIRSDENIKEIYKQEYEYEYEKKSLADSIVKAEQQKIQKAKLSEEQAKNEKKTQQQYFLLIGLAVLIGLVVFILNRLKITRSQKRIIEEKNEEVLFQKNEIEAVHKEITDSINYAKRIQNAILPPQKVIDQHLSNNFIFYLPKDVVAGDFYWMETSIDSVTNHKTVLIAAADCTGHGVPGAMVSVICNNALNRSVREYGLTDPGKILDKSKEIVIKEFEKSEEEVKDGMDIALCKIEGNQLYFAGANNSAWIVRKETKELIELKANKQPIGKYDNSSPFNTSTIEMFEGDMVYLSSDGYADQFGGENGKKFKSRNLKNYLISISHLPAAEQKEKLKLNFEDWSAGYEQLDDVCLIGIRF